MNVTAHPPLTSRWHWNGGTHAARINPYQASVEHAPISTK